MTKLKVIPAALALLALSACTTQAPFADGSSVHALVLEQTNDPGAAVRNGTTLPKTTDADRAVGAIAAMREGVAKPEETWKTQIITGGVAVTRQ